MAHSAKFVGQDPAESSSFIEAGQSTLPLEVPAETTAAYSDSTDDQETARKALDDLISRALAYRTGPELKALFDFMKRFPHLAPYNAMLLHIQNPDIQFALRAPVWERKYERRIKPAARPYVILQTMGPVAFVFDLSDTNPINPKCDLIPEIITNPFAASGQPPPSALKKLIIACLKIGIVVQEQDLPTNHAGGVIRFYDGRFRVTLNAKHSEAQHIGTVAHELGHVFCGHLGAVKDGFWPDNSNASKDAREFEAEAVAYLITDRLNLEIGSVRYLAGYLSGEKPLPNYSLDTVLKAVGKIEEMLRGTFRIRRTKSNVEPGRT
jgi:hypothetical protein